MAKKQYLTIDGTHRKVKKRYLTISDFVPRDLPSGYTQALYIESTGTQHINTGYNLQSDNMRIVTKFTHTKDEVNVCLFASESASATYSITTWLTATAVNYAAGSTGVAIAGDYYTAGKKSVLDVSAASGVITKTLNGKTKSGNYGAMLDRTLPLFIFAMNQKGSAIAAGSFRLYSFAMYDNGTLVRDYVPCRVDATGEGGLYDMVTQQFFGNAGSGAFIIGVGTGNEYRKVKKGYLTIGGVYRPFVGGGELVYYGPATNLATTVLGAKATTVAGKALFAGGKVNRSGETYTGAVNVYDSSLVKSSATSISGRAPGGAATVADAYALFVGGVYWGGSTYYVKTLDIFDAALTKTTTDFARNHSEGASVSGPEFAVFGGGRSSKSSRQSNVYAYNSSLSRVSFASLPNSAQYPQGAYVGGFYLIAGGQSDTSNNTCTNAVTVYDASGTKRDSLTMTTKRTQFASASPANYAIFAGGIDGNYTTVATVDAFDVSLTRIVAPNLSAPKREFGGAAVGPFAAFSPGLDGDGMMDEVRNTVDVYDESLTRTNPRTLSSELYNVVGTSVGNYLLFGGGQTYGGYSTYSAAVDAYAIV